MQPPHSLSLADQPAPLAQDPPPPQSLSPESAGRNSRRYSTSENREIESTSPTYQAHRNPRPLARPGAPLPCTNVSTFKSAQQRSSGLFLEPKAGSNDTTRGNILSQSNTCHKALFVRDSTSNSGSRWFDQHVSVLKYRDPNRPMGATFETCSMNASCRGVGALHSFSSYRHRPGATRITLSSRPSDARWLEPKRSWHH